MDRQPPKSVLVLCTGNSCRSQMAEVLWNHVGESDWKAVSAGSSPSGYVHDLAIAALSELGLPTNCLVSKSIDRFQDHVFDLVVTVCDNARNACPIWPSAKELLHWPFPDPAEATGTIDQKFEVFRDVRDQIKSRIEEYLAALD